ncbi:TPA: YHS domain-containing protein [Burkholderia contaminans]|nr:YHS domain-containing protein [Burkholderia vietnamiensis]MBM6430543.1 YHS domain-containing protein [Burkholderia contaminans]MCA7880875.1 YHS domain-containing protein [Burkholderia contaminans]PRG04150.1 YHS domain-containing protein [Burkholderia contaminans]
MKTIDPVCGMQIDSEKAAATEVIEGKTYYFCSSSCHEKFQANRDQYAKQHSQPEHSHRHCC